MMPSELSSLANHLWQSTLCAAAVWLLTLALKKNRAAVRYWLWLAASVKFLVPFSPLVKIGSNLGRQLAPTTAIVQPEWSYVVEDIGRPFATAFPPGPRPCVFGLNRGADGPVRHMALRFRGKSHFMVRAMASATSGSTRRDLFDA